jgi:hypothetical protein
MRSLFYFLAKWTLGLALLAGLLGIVYFVQKRSLARRAAEAAAPEPPKRAANKVIKLGAEFARSHGIEDEPAVAVRWKQRVAAYGRVVPNPRGGAELRAAFAGTLRAGADGKWPALGSRVTAGQVVGFLDIRVGPQERLDLLTKLNEARLKQAGAEEHVQLQLERVDRFRSAGAGISRAELDSAQTKLTEARTQLATARAGVKEWQNAITAIDRQDSSKDRRWSQPLAAPAGGELTDLLVRPGMAVEPGALLARLVDFRFALVRLEMPPESLPAGPPAGVELFAAAQVASALEGASNRPEPAPPARTLTGRLLGTAPQVEVNSQFAAYWYEADTAKMGSGTVWRPGLFVQAFVPVPQAAPRPAVAVPATSLLYHQGRALVYVRISPGRYERREVQVLGGALGRWILAAGEVKDRDPVVSRRAQVLLSEEFRGEADLD